MIFLVVAAMPALVVAQQGDPTAQFSGPGKSASTQAYPCKHKKPKHHHGHRKGAGGKGDGGPCKQTQI